MFARVLISFICACACINLHAQVGIITTIAGDGNQGFGGDGGPATDAKLYDPSAFCLDNLGNIFIGDGSNQRIRKITKLTGTITTIAGTGTAGFNGDNIQATDAQLNAPCKVFADTLGNIYLADGLNHRIRKINLSTGIITTVAGTGIQGDFGDGGLATNAQLNGPVGVYIDHSENIFISDYDNHKVRKIEATTGIITTIAGTGIAGFSGDNGLATNAQLSGPCAVFTDSSDNVFICDQWNHKVRKVNTSTGIITSVIGSGVAGYSGDNGQAINAKLNQPSGIFIDKGNDIFIAEYGNAVVRKIEASTGIITTIAGTGVTGFSGDGGPATNAAMRCADVFLDILGIVYIADYENNRIRKVYNPQLSINSTTKTNNNISVFPNPANDELTIEYHLANNADAVFEIIDLTGRIVTTKTLKSGKRNEIVDIHVLTPGMYLYRVSQNNMLVSTGKIIKQ